MARLPLYDAVVRAGVALSGKQGRSTPPLVLFIDDIHRAGGATLDLLAYALQRWAAARLPVLTLLDGRRFPASSELGRMGMTGLDLFPVAFLSAVEVQKFGSSPRYGTDGPGGQIDLRLKRIQTGGEVGFFYGKSDGKYGREDFQAYIIGGVGTDKVQVTAGAAYQESSGRAPLRRDVRATPQR
jgi:hypothetical protein